VLTDHSFGQRAVPANADGYVPAKASATFGIVADGVTSVELQTDEGTRRAVELFLSTGERLEIPLKDNAFLARVAPSSSPGRLVAYDAEGAVVATQLTPADA